MTKIYHQIRLYYIISRSTLGNLSALETVNNVGCTTATVDMKTHLSRQLTATDGWREANSDVRLETHKQMVLLIACYSVTVGQTTQ